MPELARQFSRKRWSSHRHGTPFTEAMLPDNSDGHQNRRPRQVSGKPNRHSLPVTFPQLSESEFGRSVSWFTTLKITRIRGALEETSLCSSTPELPLLPSPNKASIISRSLSNLRNSRVSSTAASSSPYPVSSLTTSSPSKGAFINSTADGRPPWDRRLEVAWTRYIPSGEKKKLHYDTAFRANLERLAQETPIPSPMRQRPDDQVSLDYAKTIGDSLAKPS